MVPLRRELQMIFQDPYSSLNPRHTVGSIISAPYEVQKIDPPGGVKRAVQETMERVGLNPEHYNAIRTSSPAASASASASPVPWPWAEA
jgi:ABC-type microcin C transport system duplicated ATPase subunit YejF